MFLCFFFFFSSRRRHTRFDCDWSSDVCSSDLVTVSTGQTVPDQKPVYGRLYQTPFSDRIRYEAGIPTMTGGNIASYDDVNSILTAGRADFCVPPPRQLFDPFWGRPPAFEQGLGLPRPHPILSVEGFTPP